MKKKLIGYATLRTNDNKKWNVMVGRILKAQLDQEARILVTRAKILREKNPNHIIIAT